MKIAVFIDNSRIKEVESLFEEALEMHTAPDELQKSINWLKNEKFRLESDNSELQEENDLLNYAKKTIELKKLEARIGIK